MYSEGGLECLAEAPVCKILNFHLQQKVNSILREVGDLESKYIEIEDEIGAQQPHVYEGPTGNICIKYNITYTV